MQFSLSLRCAKSCCHRPIGNAVKAKKKTIIICRRWSDQAMSSVKRNNTYCVESTYTFRWQKLDDVDDVDFEMHKINIDIIVFHLSYVQIRRKKRHPCSTVRMATDAAACQMIHSIEQFADNLQYRTEFIKLIDAVFVREYFLFIKWFLAQSEFR